jgi:hypothetical protein
LVKIVDLETRLRSLAEKREDEQEDKRKANKAAAHAPECSRRRLGRSKVLFQKSLI